MADKERPLSPIRRSLLKLATVGLASALIQGISSRVTKAETSNETSIPPVERMQAFLSSKFNSAQIPPETDLTPLQNQNETRTRYESTFTTTDGTPVSVIYREGPQAKPFFLTIILTKVGENTPALESDKLNSVMANYFKNSETSLQTPWVESKNPHFTNAPLREKLIPNPDGSRESWAAMLTGKGTPESPHGITYAVSWMHPESEHFKAGTAFFNAG